VVAGKDTDPAIVEKECEISARNILGKGIVFARHAELVANRIGVSPECTLMKLALDGGFTSRKWTRISAKAARPSPKSASIPGTADSRGSDTRRATCKKLSTRA